MTAASTYNGAGTRRDPGFIGRMWAIILKEFVQMRRDRMTFATMLFVPILQLTLFGFAINTDPKNLPTAVLVRDDGQGFDPSASARRQGSVGLNLLAALVYERGGRLRVESAAGDGTTVTLRLPVHLEGGSDDAADAATEAAR